MGAPISTQQAKPDPQYAIATLGYRVVAWLFDFAGLSAIMIVLTDALDLGQTFSATFVRADGTLVSQSGYSVGADVTDSVLLLLSAAYCIGLWHFFGGTLAQRALGMRVLDRDQPKRLSLFRAFLRWFGLYGWFFIGIASAYSDFTWPFTIAVGAWLVTLLVTAGRSGQKTGLHDRLGRDIVVRVVRQ
jgi:uncharacterized RDD family membrane protein YckC